MKCVKNNIIDEIKEDEFMNMYNNGKVVYKVSFYDRREEYKGNRSYRYFKTREGAKELVRMMEVYNDRLIDKAIETYGDYGITRDNYKNNRMWNKIVNEIDFEEVSNLEKRLFHYEDDSIGYCHIDIFEMVKRN